MGLRKGQLLQGCGADNDVQSDSKMEGYEHGVRSKGRILEP